MHSCDSDIGEVTREECITSEHCYRLTSLELLLCGTYPALPITAVCCLQRLHGAALFPGTSTSNSSQSSRKTVKGCEFYLLSSLMTSESLHFRGDISMCRAIITTKEGLCW